MGHSTAAGTTLYIGTTATIGATDTYTAVGLVSQVPEFGRIYNEVKFSPLGSRGVLKSKGSFDDGDLSVKMGKDLSDAGQLLVQAALATDYDYNFKVAANDAVPAASATVTVTIATPGVFTWTAHGLAAGTAVKFSTTGALPTGITAGTTYYVSNDANLTTNTFAVATSAANATAGTSIATTGTQSGVHTGTTVPAASYQLFKAKVMSFTTGYDNVDAVVMSTVSLSIKSGSLTDQVHLP